MSSIAEHLAAIEFYRTTGLHDAAHNEGWMFLNVHWRDLVAAWPTDEMAQGRDEFEKRVREQHPSETAANRITEWRAALTPSPAPSAAPHQGADALREDSERLDWIERHVCDVSRLGDSARTVRISWNNGADYAFVGPRYNATWREAIDAARAALAQHQAPQGTKP